MAVFWVVAPCSLVEVYQRFRGPCCLHHQGYEWFIATTQNTAIFILTAVRTSNPTSSFVILLVCNNPFCRADFFSSPQRPHQHWGPPSLLYSGFRGSFLSGGGGGGENYDSPPFCAEVKNAWSYTSTLPYVCREWYLVKHQGEICFHLWRKYLIILLDR
jgi:hypothetical protein